MNKIAFLVSLTLATIPVEGQTIPTPRPTPLYGYYGTETIPAPGGPSPQPQPGPTPFPIALAPQPIPIPNPSKVLVATPPDTNPRQFIISGIEPMGVPPSGGWVAPLSAAGTASTTATASTPFPVSWSDRRPIGTLYLTKIQTPLDVTNPAFWAFNGTSFRNWNYTTTWGIANIQQGLIALANSCVAQLKKINAQGVICWDSEGEQWGGLFYFGSPNAIPWMVPEFDQVSDQFWNVFKAAGLRIGVCLRADESYWPAQGTGSHAENQYTSVSQAEADLDAKLSYAHDRWGCTLFYVDSNGGSTIGSHEPGQYYPAVIFQYLQQKHPDCLIIPELHYGVGGENGPLDNYYLWTAGYGQYRLGDPHKDALDLASVPRAFMGVDVSDSGITGTDPVMIDFVKSGGALLTRCWTDQNNEQEAVASIYKAAGANLPTPTQKIRPH